MLETRPCGLRYKFSATRQHQNLIFKLFSTLKPSIFKVESQETPQIKAKNKANTILMRNMSLDSLNSNSSQENTASKVFT